MIISKIQWKPCRTFFLIHKYVSPCVYSLFSRHFFFAKVSCLCLCGVLSNFTAARSRACVHFYFLHISQMRRHYHHIPSICVFGLLLQTWHFDLHGTEVFTYPLILIVAQQGKLGRKGKKKKKTLWAFSNKACDTTDCFQHRLRGASRV